MRRPVVLCFVPAAGQRDSGDDVDVLDELERADFDVRVAHGEGMALFDELSRHRPDVVIAWGKIAPLVLATAWIRGVPLRLSEQPGRLGGIFRTHRLVNVVEQLTRVASTTSRQAGLPLLLKRALDLSVAVPAILAAAPLLAGSALVIRVGLGAPVLFRQPRPGRGGREFLIYKFRTMTSTRDADGRLLPDEQRLTHLGRLLRATSLDELPQLINVIAGDMSLVGPRPLLTEYLDRYSTDQRRRHNVLPGITGLAQINGRNATTWPQRLRLDVEYADRWSLLLDLAILAQTVRAVLRREGVSQPGHATMPNFMGESD